MALSQIQIIQSLGEAMTWFQKELDWGVNPAVLKHLTGRIGELYAALITNGQMALGTHERGYDVVGEDGERISVKTTTMLAGSGHVSFNANTLGLVDRVIILRINIEEMQIETLLDVPLNQAKAIMSANGDIALSKLNQRKSHAPLAHHQETVRCVDYKNLKLTELESGTIEIKRPDGSLVAPAIEKLREIAAELGISPFNSQGNRYNTRQLGTFVIRTIKGISAESDVAEITQAVQ